MNWPAGDCTCGWVGGLIVIVTACVLSPGDCGVRDIETLLRVVRCAAIVTAAVVARTGVTTLRVAR